MHLAWEQDQRPVWQVHLTFLSGHPRSLHDANVQRIESGDGDAVQRLERTIRETGKTRAVRVEIEDDEVAVSLRIRAATRSKAIPDAYHLVRVAARVASSALLGEVRHADAIRWPPPVAGGT